MKKKMKIVLFTSAVLSTVFLPIACETPVAYVHNEERNQEGDGNPNPNDGDQNPGDGDQNPGDGDNSGGGDNPGGGDQNPGGDDNTGGGDDNPGGGDEVTPKEDKYFETAKKYLESVRDSKKSNATEETFKSLEIYNKNLEDVYQRLGLEEQEIFANKHIRVDKNENSLSVTFRVTNDATNQEVTIKVDFQIFYTNFEPLKEALANLHSSDRSRESFKNINIDNPTSLETANEDLGIYLSSAVRAELLRFDVTVQKSKDSTKVTYTIKNKYGVQKTTESVIDDFSRLFDIHTPDNQDYKDIFNNKVLKFFMTREEFYNYEADNKLVSARKDTLMSLGYFSEDKNYYYTHDQIDPRVYMRISKAKESYKFTLSWYITDDETNEELELHSITKDLAVSVMDSQNQWPTFAIYPEMEDFYKYFANNFFEIHKKKADFLNEEINMTSDINSIDYDIKAKRREEINFSDQGIFGSGYMDVKNDPAKYDVLNEKYKALYGQFFASGSFIDTISSFPKKAKGMLSFVQTYYVVFFRSAGLNHDFFFSFPLTVFQTDANEAKSKGWDKSSPVTYNKSPLENIKRDDLFTLFKVKVKGETEEKYFVLYDYDDNKFKLKDLATNEFRYLSTTGFVGSENKEVLGLSTADDANQELANYQEVESAQFLFA